ncbi:MAG: hypothetical protein JWL94_2159 [Microbacteriaceae bacterium]|jgi:hypothetical protein|nr:hypothetical protein [Microbacteriaceae bacterium]
MTDPERAASAVDVLEPTGSPASSQPRRPIPSLGAVSVGLSLLCLAGDTAAIFLASNGEYVVSALLAQAVILLSVAAFFAGILAAILRRRRRLGLAGAGLALVANPLVALVVLGFFGSL